MGEFTLKTQASYLQKARPTNQTSTTFVAKIPTITRPNSLTDSATSQQVFDFTGGSVVPNVMDVIPYGTASNDNTMSVRVIKWTQQPGSKLWIPVLLCQVDCTASSTFPGIAGQSPANTELFCDTVTAVIPASADGSFRVVSPGAVTANSGIGHFSLDLEAGVIYEVTFSTGSSATDVNALVNFR